MIAFRYNAKACFLLGLVLMPIVAFAQVARGASDVVKKTTYPPDQLIDVSQAAEFILQSNPTLIFLGEDHENLHLADGVLALLVNVHEIRPIKCLFVEFPSDLQADVDASVAAFDPIRLYRAFHTTMKPAYLEAFARMGYDSAGLAASSKNIDAVIEKADSRDMNSIFLSDGVFFFLRMNSIPMLAYNVDSRSKELLDGVYYQFMVDLPAPDPDRAILNLQAINARNQIMIKNLLAKAKSHDCTNAVVIVGRGHLTNHRYIQSHWGKSIAFTSMQTSLETEGYSSVVVIVLSSGGELDTQFMPNPDTSGAFEQHVGTLLTP